MIKKLLVVIVCMTFLGCDLMNDLFNKDPYKVVEINDTDPFYSVQIKYLEKEYVVLALIDHIPDLKTLTAEEVMDAPYSIGRIKNGVISLRISRQLDYWNDHGNFWIVFILPDGRGEKISHAYLSKESHNITEKVTHVSNNDFMPAVEVNMDFSGYLPY